MTRNRFFWPVVYVAAIAILAAGVGVRLAADGDRGPDQPKVSLPTLRYQPFRVTVSSPPSKSVVRGTVIPLRVEAGKAERVEAFLDGIEVGSAPVNNGVAVVPVPTPWPGNVLVVPRAVSEDDEVAIGSPVDLAVRDSAPGTRDAPVDVPVAEDESDADVADRLGLPDGSVQPGRRSTALGTFASVTVPAGTTAPTAGDDAQSVKLATPPVDPKSCEAVLETEPGATISVASAATPGFVNLGTAQSNGNFTLGGLGAGAWAVVATVDDAPSNPKTIVVPDACGDPWKGDASLLHGILTLEKVPDPFWIYLRGGKHSYRIPANDDAVLQAQTRRIDISSVLPAISEGPLHLEVWSRVGTKATKFAEADAELPDGTTPASVIGEPSAIRVFASAGTDIDTSLVLTDETEVTVSAEMASPRVDRVLWQVTTHPMSTKDLSLTPPGLLASGVAGTNANGRADFTIDTAKLPRNPTLEVFAGVISDDGGKTDQPVSGPVGFGVGFDPASQKPGSSSIASPQDFDIDKKLVEIDDDAEVVETPTTTLPARDRVYIRVLPMAGAQLLGTASTNIDVALVPVIFVPPGALAEPPKVSVDSVSLFVGNAPNQALRSCINVTEVPWDNAAPTPPPLWGAPQSPGSVEYTAAKAFYPSTGIYCPSDFPSSDDDCLLCFVDAALDGLADLYDSTLGKVGEILSQFAVVWLGLMDGLAGFIAFVNPVCRALGYADDGAQATCENLTKAIAKDVVMQIPNVFALGSSAIGLGSNLVHGNIVGLYDQLGIDCDDIPSGPQSTATAAAMAEELGTKIPDGIDTSSPCDATVGVLIGSLRDSMQQQFESQLAASTGMPYFPNVAGLHFTIPDQARLKPFTVVVTGHTPEGTAVEACDANVALGTPYKISAPYKGGSLSLTESTAGAGFDFGFGLFDDALEDAVNSAAPPGTQGWSGVRSFGTPAFASLDVDSVFEGFKVTATVDGPCIAKPVTTTAEIGPALPR